MSKITERNKILAEFMDLKIISEGVFKGDVSLKEFYTLTKFHEFIQRQIEISECFYGVITPEFHESWDWLMFVIQKINSLDLWNVDEYYDIRKALFTVNINDAFNVCVNCVKRYNLETCH